MVGKQILLHATLASVLAIGANAQPVRGLNNYDLDGRCDRVSVDSTFREDSTVVQYKHTKYTCNVASTMQSASRGSAAKNNFEFYYAVEIDFYGPDSARIRSAVERSAAIRDLENKEQLTPDFYKENVRTPNRLQPFSPNGCEYDMLFHAYSPGQKAVGFERRIYGNTFVCTLEVEYVRRFQRDATGNERELSYDEILFTGSDELRAKRAQENRLRLVAKKP